MGTDLSQILLKISQRRLIQKYSNNKQALWGQNIRFYIAQKKFWSWRLVFLLRHLLVADNYLNLIWSISHEIINCL